MSTRRKVLILEDDYLLAASLAEFAAEAGYEVVGPAASLDTAQSLINEKGIDAALLDIRLGRDDRSFELAARLKALHVPFAFVTSYSRALWPLAFQQAPCITKPVSQTGVAGVLSELLPDGSGS